uniref:Uncharacterized protein n=1 Tax=Ananas comosus var. bracteatus TaxID=296719 RepID=A0A6V7QN31_ANACO|nr:unnamed protein product [Ananas comosus var. bracteatus]
MEGISSASLSARASEIAKSREELLRLLNDVPESDYELSLTDLVEKEGLMSERGAVTKEKNIHDDETKEKRPKMNERKRRDRRSSCGSSSEGVLLNFYVPTSLTRSLTAARTSRGGVDQRANTEYNKRDRESAATPGCWSALLECRRGKSKRAILQSGR